MIYNTENLNPHTLLSKYIYGGIMHCVNLASAS